MPNGTEFEDGVDYYEIESIDGKTKRDLLYTKDGKVCEIEEVVDVKALPDAVKQAVAKVYPQGKIQKAEKTTRQTKIEYDLEVQSGAKGYEVSVDEQGKVLKTAEMKAKKEEKEEKEDEEDEESKN